MSTKREPHPKVWPFPTYKGEPYKPPAPPAAKKPPQAYVPAPAPFPRFKPAELD